MTPIDVIIDQARAKQIRAAGGQTQFDYPFPIFNASDLRVNVEGTDLAPTAYSVSGVGNDMGGTVTLSQPLAAETLVTLYAVTAIDRLTDYQFRGRFDSERFNNELDKMTINLQELRDQIARTLRLPLSGEIGDPADLLLPADGDSRNNRVIGFDATGRAELRSVDLEQDPRSLATAQSVAGLRDLIVIDPNANLGKLPTIEAMRAIPAPVNASSTEVTDVNRGGLFVFLAASTRAVDNINVFTAADGTPGRWRRVTNAASQFEPPTSFRNLKEVFDASSPLSILPGQVVIEKRRTDFVEFAVYTPISADGQWWARWYMQNRIRGGALAPGDGPANCFYVSLAGLYGSAEQAKAAPNDTTGTFATAPTDTYACADATARDASFTTPATVGGVTDISHSTTTGDSVTYTVTVPAGGMIVARGYCNTSNGGAAEVIIRDSLSDEIDQEKYACAREASKNVVRYNVFTSPGPNKAHLAKGLDAGTYTVQLIVDELAGAGRRLYDGGIEVYAPVAYNAVGLHGYVTTQSLGGITWNRSPNPGALTVYQVNDATGIKLRYWQTTVNTIIRATVYDSGGSQVAQVMIDTYGGQGLSQVQLLNNAAKGTYFVHLETLNVRNPSATRWDFYENGFIVLDETSIGVPGVDQFDALSFPLSFSSGAWNAVGTHILLGPGAFEYATEWRSPSSTPGDRDFVGTVHGYESNITNSTIEIEVDGVPIAWNAATVGQMFAGRSIQIRQLTTLRFPDNAANFATLEYLATFSPAGYRVKTTRTMTADGIAHLDYSLMLQAPNGGDWRSDDVGGPLVHVAFNDDPIEYLPNNSDDATYNQWTVRQRGVACASDEYGAYCFYQNFGQIVNDAVPFNHDGRIGLLRDNSSNQWKAYGILFSADEVNGKLIPSGNVSVVDKIYRVFKGDFFRSLL